MNNKNLLFIVALSVYLSACGGDKGNEAKVKSAFINHCISQESSTRPADQAKAYCDCAADKVFNNANISAQTKNLMPTINDKDTQVYQQSDAALVKGSLMSCYTAKFYKK
ncbi:MAG: hypothetical protein ACXWAT_10885 [Methylobacter sp.]